MATIRICDWSKQPIPRGQDAITLSVNGVDFEISQQSADSLFEMLNSDAPVAAPAPAPVVQRIDTGRPEPAPAAATATSAVEVPPAPEDLSKPLGMPSAKVADQVIKESTRFAEGGLDTLTPGAARSQATKKLAAVEDSAEESIRRRAGRDVNFNQQ